jgi:transcription elongation factor Elf1
MTGKDKKPETKFLCGKCKQELVLGKVVAVYLDNTFPVDLLKCPTCGMAYVPEALALGRMASVEQQLEDK